MKAEEWADIAKKKELDSAHRDRVLQSEGAFLHHRLLEKCDAIHTHVNIINGRI